MTSFILSKETLLKPLQSVVTIADKKHTNPILGTVLCRISDNKLILKAFDSETEVIATIDLSSTSDNAIFTLPARKTIEIVRNLSDGAKVEISYQENRQVIIRSGSSKFSLFSLDPKLFPTLNEDTGQSIFKLPLISLLQSLKRVQFAMANNDFRYFLNGMLWEIENNKFKTVATDGHRMASSTTTIENIGLKSLQMIIPRKAILELQKTTIDYDSTAEVQAGKNYFKLILPSYQFASKLIDASYPDYSCVIPKNNNKHVVANRNELKQALLRTSILSNEQYRGVRLRLEKNQLLLAANNPENEQAEDGVPIKYNGETIEVGFNIGYFLDVVNAVSGEMIDLYFDNAAMSLLIKDKTSNSLYVVSPIRL